MAEEHIRFYFHESARGPAIFHDPGPNKMKFPVLFVDEYISGMTPAELGNKVAEILNQHWPTDS
jgi:hypothetical protein